jgi:hypothetical protein
MKKISIFPWENPKSNNLLAETHQNKRAKTHTNYFNLLFHEKEKIYLV